MPRKLKRELRAAIFNLTHGMPLREGETVQHLAGLAAYVHMTDPKLGAKMLEALGQVAVAPPDGQQ